MPFSEILSFARRLGRRAVDPGLVLRDPMTPMTWVSFQLEDGVKRYVPMVTVTAGSDRHVAFLNIPNFGAAVCGGIEALTAIAVQRRPAVTPLPTIWEVEFNRWGEGVVGRRVTFARRDGDTFVWPQWHPPSAMPTELHHRIVRTYSDLIATGFLKEQEVDYGIA